MQTISLTQIVRCPNCGSVATRHYYNHSEVSKSGFHLNQQLIHTECSTCDYLLKMRTIDGSVIEAYAPSIHPVHFSS
ncbi:hypothetical protein [Pleurocapsa sp. PCC 7319]|uniref:hypothetical protein n=1 Tax=Pleurocapsa sp. PCC 7319 TaxID=118161 RepID=UPI001ED9C54D|nr:hypothetical protein [Pleurocapsa sp. PCC 7319]